MRSAPTLKIWMTPLASVAMLEKFALLKMARCKAPALNRTSSRSCNKLHLSKRPGSEAVVFLLSGKARASLRMWTSMRHSERTLPKSMAWGEMATGVQMFCEIKVLIFRVRTQGAAIQRGPWKASPRCDQAAQLKGTRATRERRDHPKRLASPTTIDQGYLTKYTFFAITPTRLISAFTLKCGPSKPKKRVAFAAIGKSLTTQPLRNTVLSFSSERSRPAPDIIEWGIDAEASDGRG